MSAQSNIGKTSGKLAFSALAVALFGLFAAPAKADSSTHIAFSPESMVELPIELDKESGETKAEFKKQTGKMVGKARIRANGDLSFTISTSVGVLRKNTKSVNVLVSADAAIKFYSGSDDLKGQTISLRAALERLNKNPSLISISGKFDANTSTFIAEGGLEIVS